ncbi:MAG: hypothetical protein H0V88_01660 [Pyrinomonadaceae bacterium]|nr:hypothetical protein [Pyrinomonadaceae bacterium]
MWMRLIYGVTIWFVMILSSASFLTDAHAQGRRRRPSRRITNPVAPRPTPPVNSSTDAQIISTAEDQSSSSANDPAADGNEAGGTRAGSGTRRGTGSETQNETQPESLQRTVNRLSSQVTGLTNDLNQLKEQQRTLINLERLTRTEQRAETLRAQQRDVMKQEADLQARAEALEYELRPESIERRAALSGSTRPEEARAQLQRQLQSEQERVRAQLNVLTSSRQRLETAVANADAETDRLRQLTDRDTSDEAQTNRRDSNQADTNATALPTRSTQSTNDASAPPSPPAAPPL